MIEVGVLPMEAQSGSPLPPLYTNSQELTIFEASAPDKRGCQWPVGVTISRQLVETTLIRQW